MQHPAQSAARNAAVGCNVSIYRSNSEHHIAPPVDGVFQPEFGKTLCHIAPTYPTHHGLGRLGFPIVAIGHYNLCLAIGTPKKKVFHGPNREYPSIQPYLRPTIVGRSPPLARPRTTGPTPCYSLVATRQQVDRGCSFPQACNGRTTPHGMMYIPPQSASNIDLHRWVIGRGLVPPVDNYIGGATVLVTGIRHGRAPHPHPSWQRSPPL